MRTYTSENFWGPFQDDGKATVDWERMEAVMIVLGYNMKNYTQSMHGIYPPLWKDPFRGASPGSFEPLSVTKRKVPLGPVDLEDPYNVAGTWHRVSYPFALVMTLLTSFLGCLFLRYASLHPFPISIPIPRPLIRSFLELTPPDFHELHHYNFGQSDPGPGIPLPPIDTTEAVRMISMEITVSDIKRAGEVDGPGENDDPNWPVVLFKGTSRSMHAAWDSNANSNIRGRVSVTREGEVRWTTWSIYWG
jgi:hypothetical protein